MRSFILLIALFPLLLKGATNIQHIQLFTGGTNNGLLSQSVLDAGAIGSGVWDLQSGFGFTNRFLKVGTNHAYRLPGWVTKDGINYDAVSTNWVYYDLGSNAPVNDWEQFRFRVQTTGNGGPQSNLVSEFFLFLDGVASAATDAPNIDHQVWAGQFGASTYLQIALRTNNAHVLYAHGGATNGWQIPCPTNIVYLVQSTYSALDDTFSVQLFNATNNFAAITNFSGTGGTGSVTPTGPATNAYEIRYQANYLNTGTGAKGSGRIWMSSPIHYWSSNAVARTPETNIIISDRTTPLLAGSTVGMVSARPNRTVETNGSFYNMDSASEDNTTNFNAAFTAAASNTVVLIDGASGHFKIRGTVSLNTDGVTLRGTNNAKILVGAGANFNVGPTVLSVNQGKQFAVTNGTAIKGATNLTLTTNYSAVGSAGVITYRQIYQISQRNGSNPQLRRIGTSYGDRITSQDVIIVGTNGNSVTVWPPLVMDFTNSPMLLQKYTVARQMIGIENVTITLTNGGVYETNAGTHNLLAQGLFNSWIAGSQFLYGNNYLVDLNQLISCEVNSNQFRYASPRSGEHAGIQMTGGTGNLIADNIIQTTDRSFQLFGGVVGNAFVGNYGTASSGQAARLHAPGNNFNLWERNYFGGDFVIIGDGYFGSNESSTYYWNVANFITGRRFNPLHNIVRNVVQALGEFGYPNPGNNNTNGLSKYQGAYASQELFSGWKWNDLQTNFTGSFGVAPYVNRPYTNIIYEITNSSLQIVNGTNILGDFTNATFWPFADGSDDGASYGYAVVFRLPDGSYRSFADTTNDLIAQIAWSWRASVAPTETNMFLNHYVPPCDGCFMMIAGPDNFQQRQTIDDETLMQDLNLVNGSLVDDVEFLPQNLPDWISYSSTPSWWSGVTWPNANPAKVRFDGENYTAVTNAAPRLRGIRFR